MGSTTNSQDLGPLPAAAITREQFEDTFPPAAGTPEDESYQQFLDSMVQYCRCRDSNRPCDGVLAGGLCDNLQDDDLDLERYGDDESDDGYPFDLTT